MDDANLRVLIHQNPAFVTYMEGFNQRFQDANPGVTVDMTVVNSGDMASAINTRTTANDVDVIDFCAGSCSAFSNGIEAYMGDNYGEKPIWQQLIEAGLLMDLTDEPFVANFDETAVQDATTFNDRVYAIPMGRVTYSGMFVNETLLADVGASIPTTWSELVSVCEAVVDSGNSCMTVGGGDGWPIFVGASGVLGSIFPDQAALAEGLWDGSITWNEGKGLEAIQKFQTFSTDMLESGVTGLSHDEATARYAGGDVAFMPTGMWQAPNLESFEPAFDWTYVPVPGSDTAADNQYLWGKYDMSWMISADTPQPDVAKAYLAALSEPAEYQAYLDAVGFLPTQPTASLNSKLGDAVADLVPAYRVGLEQYWVSPSGAGQWADGRQAASWFAPFNEWTDATELANQVQADLQAGLDS
jgi:raffinose/stachyose/melibiose transport system substrate-binding protein